MNGNPIPHKIPEEISQPRKKSSRPTIQKVGIALAEELAEIVDRLGQNHPDLPTEILEYVKTMNAKHPGWRAFWREQARRQQQKIARPPPTS